MYGQHAVAVKFVQASDRTEAPAGHFMEEINLLKTFRHENIVSFVEAIERVSHICQSV